MGIVYLYEILNMYGWGGRQGLHPFKGENKGGG